MLFPRIPQTHFYSQQSDFILTFETGARDSTLFTAQSMVHSEVRTPYTVYDVHL